MWVYGEWAKVLCSVVVGEDGGVAVECETFAGHCGSALFFNNDCWRHST